MNPTQVNQLVDAGLFEPENFARLFLRIKDKKMRIVPFAWNRMQRHLYANLTGRDIVLKPRQPGISTFVQALQEQAAMFSTASVMTYADIGENAKKLRAIGNRFYNSWPEELLSFRPPRDKDNISVVTYPRTDSESIIATAGSKVSGHASTLSHLHFSEFAHYEDAQTIMAFTMPAATPDAKIVIESTPHGAQGLFYEMCMDALDGSGEWRLHFYTWWWAKEYALSLEPGEELLYSEEELDLIEKARRNGFALTPEQIKWRRSKLSGAEGLMFAQEYPEDIQTCFLTSGRGVFGDLTDCLIDPYRTEPIEQHFMVAGVDWGQADDYTALSIIDMDDMEEVFIGRWRRIGWDDIIARIVEHCQHWNVTGIQPEMNAMSANVNDLIKAIDGAGMGQTVISPFTTTNASKDRAVKNLYNGIHRHNLKLLKTNIGHSEDRDYATMEMKSFINKQTKLGTYIYDHAEGAKSDTVIARMLAYDYGCKTTFGF